MTKVYKINVDKNFSYVSGGEFVGKYSWIHSERKLDTHVLLIQITGNAYISCNDIEYFLQPSEMLFMPANIIHVGTKNTNSPNFMWFHFHADIEEVEESSIYQTDASTGNLQFSILPKHFAIHEFSKVLIKAKQILDHSEEILFHKVILHCEFSSLLFEIWQQCFKFYCENDSSTFPAYKIREYLRVNIRGDISLPKLSQQFSYNPQYLSKKFKEFFGHSIIDYVNQQKLEKCKELLLTTNLKIADISKEAGFNDEKYMMRIFKKENNMTPTDYRNSHDKIHMNIQ